MPLYPPSVCQISRQADNAFAFYSTFCKCVKRGRKIRKKAKKLSQYLKSHISGTLEAISLKFGMWSTEVGEHVHRKNRLVSSRHHVATEVRKLCFHSSCQHTHGCCAPASWAARHTTVCLDYRMKSEVSIMLCCRLCSTRCTAVCTKSTLAIKVTTMKVRMISVTEGSHHVLQPNRHFSLSGKMNGTQWRRMVSP